MTAWAEAGRTHAVTAGPAGTRPPVYTRAVLPCACDGRARAARPVWTGGWRPGGGWGADGEEGLRTSVVGFLCCIVAPLARIWN